MLSKLSRAGVLLALVRVGGPLGAVKSGYGESHLVAHAGKDDLVCFLTV